MPADNVIVFDGVCEFCSRFAMFIIKRDKQGKFLFAPVQSAAGEELLKRHGMNADDVRSFLLVKGGMVYLRSGAALEIAGELGGGWRLLRVLALVPGVIRDWFYDVFARNRYRWFGKRDSCMVPPENVKSRFLA